MATLISASGQKAYHAAFGCPAGRPAPSMRKLACTTVSPIHMVFITAALAGQERPNVGHVKRKMADEKVY